jgi:uncharacterized delta-60 repeat protein/RHS repeat-associated protein
MGHTRLGDLPRSRKWLDVIALLSGGAHASQLANAVSGGTISDGSATYTRNWNLDALGNWSSLVTDADGGGGGGATTETRTHNAQNQLTIHGSNYDANGNQQNLTGGTHKYDAWNRLAHRVEWVAVGGNVVDMGPSWRHDALGRRVQEPAGIGTTDYYHSAGWQVIEERSGGTATHQNVWSLAYIDALVLRDTLDAADGSLDTSFSGDGKLVLNAPGSLGDEFKTVVQSDGKVVAAGYVGTDVAVVRFTADGWLDTSFDTDGYAITDFGGNNDRATDVTIQPDGKIVIAGSSRGVNNRGDVIVGRYNVNGSLDTSFDTDGKYKADFGDGDQIYAVEVDAGGKIVLAGSTNDNAPNVDLLVVRLTSTGALDTSFDSDGRRIIDLGDATKAQGMALDRSGRIVLAGNTTTGSDQRALMVRLTGGGAYDTSFSGDGQHKEDFGGSDEFTHLAVDDRGRIVAAGNGGTNGAGTGQDGIAARFTDAGALDTTFDSDGKKYVNLGSSADDVEDLALDPFGRAVLVGDDGGVDFAVARLTEAGALDTTFDSDGLVKVDFGAGSGEDGQAVAIQTDGKIIVVGRQGNDFAVARLSGGDTRVYAQQDANFNTTAVTDATGKVLERYQYDPYGTVTVLNADWSPDPDGVQDVDEPFLWQGGALVTATGTYHFRRRDVSPSLGRPTSADPLGYVDGMNRHQWEGSNPVGNLDPWGLYHGGVTLPGGGYWGLEGPTGAKYVPPGGGNPPVVTPPPAPAPAPPLTPAAAAAAELQAMHAQATRRNATQPYASQCYWQAADLMNDLRGTRWKYWWPVVIGYEDYLKHYVMVLQPTEGNPLAPQVLDGFHSPVWLGPLWTNSPPNFSRRVDCYPLQDFLDRFPKPLRPGTEYVPPKYALPNQIPKPPKPKLNTDPWPYNPMAPKPY